MLFVFIDVPRYKPILDSAIDMSGVEPNKCIIYQRDGLEKAELKAGGRDVSWEEAVSGTRLHDCVPVEANEAMYVLYTSGTTGNLPWLTSHSQLLDLDQLLLPGLFYDNNI